MASEKERFLQAFDREHATTMRVLRAFPKGQLDLKPNPKLKSARELAWVFALENYLSAKVWRDDFAKQTPSGKPPAPPESWDEILGAIDKGAAEFRGLVANASDAELSAKVHFFTGPKTLGETSRMDWAWFILSDQIHHRGQFSVYLRFTDAKLPSIYGPTADEPWI